MLSPDLAGQCSMTSSTFIRICALCTILAGTLRAITSFIPETTPNVLLLYLVIDLSLLFGIIGLYRFAVTTAKLLPLLGTAVMCLALALLLGRDLGIAPANIYAGAAAAFSVGLDLFAIYVL